MNKVFYLVLLIFLIIFTQLSSLANDEEILIIFDSSISMREDFYGSPKYISAVNEAKLVLDKLSPSKKIGLRIIGLTLDSSLLSFIKNPSELCKATQLVVPIRENNIEYIKNSMDTIMPLGTTPLTYTLETSLKYDFTRYAKLKHIILVTDGAESCNRNPCEYVKEITSYQKDIKIDIMAIGVTLNDYQQLKCLADYTNGSIINIEKPSEFKNAFDKFLSPDYSQFKMPAINNKRVQNSQIIYKNYLIETYK
ncbi:TPA: VWA domain-containing protein [Candidatus Avigastranaerophilus faecigallinarum]|nr:VWA domain-containing protein [Candidatus Avigastranaerophilus faecigallinarum]